MQSDVKELKELRPGEQGIIEEIGGEGSIRRRIIDMGLVRGKQVRVQKYAPLGDPIEIKVMGFNLSLRKKEAQIVKIRVYS